MTTAKEFSAGAVIFRRTPKGVRFLLLHYADPFSKTHEPYWGLVKGHIEGKETPQETTRREAYEETGIRNLQFIEGFVNEIAYDFQRPERMVRKKVTYLLAETKESTLRVAPPHLGYAWLSYEEALRRVTHENTSRVLRNAHKFLNGRS